LKFDIEVGLKDTYVLSMSFCLYVDNIDMATMRNFEAKSNKCNVYGNSITIDLQNRRSVHDARMLWFRLGFHFPLIVYPTILHYGTEKKK
jgi:hypothetical protein